MRSASSRPALYCIKHLPPPTSLVGPPHCSPMASLFVDTYRLGRKRRRVGGGEEADEQEERRLRKTVVGVTFLSEWQRLFSMTAAYGSLGVFCRLGEGVDDVVGGMFDRVTCFAYVKETWFKVGVVRSVVPGLDDRWIAEIEIDAWSPLSHELKMQGVVTMHLSGTDRLSAECEYDGPALSTGETLTAVVETLHVPMVRILSGGFMSCTLAPFADAWRDVRDNLGAMMHGRDASSFATALRTSTVTFPLSPAACVDEPLHQLLSGASKMACPASASPWQWVRTCPLYDVDLERGDDVVKLSGGVMLCDACKRHVARTTHDNVQHFSAEAVVRMFQADAGLRWHAGEVFGLLPLRSKIVRRFIFGNPAGCFSGRCLKTEVTSSTVAHMLVHADLSPTGRHRAVISHRINSLRKIADSMTYCGDGAWSDGIAAVREYLRCSCAILERMLTSSASCFSGLRMNVGDSVQKIARGEGVYAGLVVDPVYQHITLPVPPLPFRTPGHVAPYTPLSLHRLSVLRSFWDDVAGEGAGIVASCALSIARLMERACVPTCPTCDTPVVLDEGCTHAMCEMCGTHFCMACAKPFLTGAAPTSLHDVGRNLLSAPEAGEGCASATLAEVVQNYALQPSLSMILRTIHTLAFRRCGEDGARLDRVAAGIMKARDAKFNLPSDVYYHASASLDGYCPMYMASLREQLEKEEALKMRWDGPLAEELGRLWKSGEVAFSAFHRAAKMVSDFMTFAVDMGRGKEARDALALVLRVGAAVREEEGDGLQADGIGLTTTIWRSKGGVDWFCKHVSYYSRRSAERTDVEAGVDGASLPSVRLLSQPLIPTLVEYCERTGIRFDE